MRVDRLLTLEEFDELPDDGSGPELRRGRLERRPAESAAAGRVTERLAARLDGSAAGGLVRNERFLLATDPPTVLAPTLAWLRGTGEEPDGPTSRRSGPPAFAVEVAASSSDGPRRHDRALDLLEAGTTLVWVVEPEASVVTVYRPDARVELRDGDAVLDAGELLPGFSLPVSELFSP